MNIKKKILNDENTGTPYHSGTALFSEHKYLTALFGINDRVSFINWQFKTSCWNFLLIPVLYFAYVVGGLGKLIFFSLLSSSVIFA